MGITLLLMRNTEEEFGSSATDFAIGFYVGADGKIQCKIDGNPPFVVENLPVEEEIRSNFTNGELNRGAQLQLTDEQEQQILGFLSSLSYLTDTVWPERIRAELKRRKKGEQTQLKGQGIPLEAIPPPPPLIEDSAAVLDTASSIGLAGIFTGILGSQLLTILPAVLQSVPELAKIILETVGWLAGPVALPIFAALSAPLFLLSFANLLAFFTLPPEKKTLGEFLMRGVAFLASGLGLAGCVVSASFTFGAAIIGAPIVIPALFTISFAAATILNGKACYDAYKEYRRLGEELKRFQGTLEAREKLEYKFKEARYKFRVAAVKTAFCGMSALGVFLGLCLPAILIAVHVAFPPAIFITIGAILAATLIGVGVMAVCSLIQNHEKNKSFFARIGAKIGIGGKKGYSYSKVPTEEPQVQSTSQYQPLLDSSTSKVVRQIGVQAAAEAKASTVASSATAAVGERVKKAGANADGGKSTLAKALRFFFGRSTVSKPSDKSHAPSPNNQQQVGNVSETEGKIKID